jgi:hypothetical protein
MYCAGQPRDILDRDHKRVNPQLMAEEIGSGHFDCKEGLGGRTLLKDL